MPGVTVTATHRTTGAAARGGRRADVPSQAALSMAQDFGGGGGGMNGGFGGASGGGVYGSQPLQWGAVPQQQQQQPQQATPGAPLDPFAGLAF